jgi:hypothetical protein
MEEYSLRAFENRLLQMIFGQKRDEMMREWRKLHNEELCDLSSLQRFIIILKLRRMRWARNAA